MVIPMAVHHTIRKQLQELFRLHPRWWRDVVVNVSRNIWRSITHGEAVRREGLVIGILSCAKPTHLSAFWKEPEEGHKGQGPMTPVQWCRQKNVLPASPQWSLPCMLEKRKKACYEHHLETETYSWKACEKWNETSLRGTLNRLRVNQLWSPPSPMKPENDKTSAYHLNPLENKDETNCHRKENGSLNPRRAMVVWMWRWSRWLMTRWGIPRDWLPKSDLMLVEKKNK